MLVVHLTRRGRKLHRLAMLARFFGARDMSKMLEQAAHDCDVRAKRILDSVSDVLAAEYMTSCYPGPGDCSHKPPKGWLPCTRGLDHDGPCALWPDMEYQRQHADIVTLAHLHTWVLGRHL